VTVLTHSTNDITLAYAAILTMAVVPIYIGSHMSIKEILFKDRSECEEGAMTSKDAYMFPLVASCFLFGLYIVFKLFSAEWVNFLLTSYVILLGFYSLMESFRPGFAILLPNLDQANPKTYHYNIPYFAENKKIDVTSLDYVNFVFTAVIVMWYLLTKHWISNNIIGLCFAVQGISKFPIGNYKVGCILLSGLFFYDIFWVFGTDVMVTVAKSFDAPIKVMFPKSLFAATYKHSMLGLGDIVLPGVFIAFLLRYDFHKATTDKKNQDGFKSFKKTYFTMCFFGYIAGLVLTIAIMHNFQAAQPALLYLTPACIFTSYLTGLYLSDLDNLFAYSEEEEPKEKEKSQKTTDDDLQTDASDD